MRKQAAETIGVLPFTKTYGEARALSCPGLSLEKGKIYAVVGANGSGKSTLAKILAGVLSADGKAPAYEKENGGWPKVGYLPQKSYAFRMSTRRNLLLNGSRDPKVKKRCDELLQQLEIEYVKDRNAKLLSGGEMARMAMARLLVKSYDLLILDEPTAAADIRSTVRMEESLRTYREETGCAVLLVTHSLKQARRLAEEVLFFSGGELLERGVPEQVFDRPREPKVREFLEFYQL